MANFEYEEAWVQCESRSLAQRYGVGTFVAVFDAAVIDWGPIADDVRERAEKVIGEPVFVGVVPASSVAEDDYDGERVESEANYKRLIAAARGRKFQRRCRYGKPMRWHLISIF